MASLRADKYVHTKLRDFICSETPRDAELQDPITYDGPSDTQRYVEFRKKTTSLNVAKMLLLRHTYAGLEELWTVVMSGRPAQNVNKLLGAELEHLLEVAEAGYVVCQEEVLRMWMPSASHIRSSRSRHSLESSCLHGWLTSAS